MAHHQHHGAEYEAHMSRSLEATAAVHSSMPSISEDEQLADLDEPPERLSKFSKHSAYFPTLPRRESLLTRALHTDSEHDDDHYPSSYFTKLPSVSSTCSNPSVRSTGDFTSDDGHVSPSTRPSTPGSPHSILVARSIPPPVKEEPKPLQLNTALPADTIEATLGRKRCIMFSCGGKDKPVEKVEPKPQPKPEPEVKPIEPLKRTCSIKFACPFKAEKPKEAPKRQLSPAPAAPTQRRHRDSDTTIRLESPLVPKSPQSVRRRFVPQTDVGRTDACRFHEFASEEEEAEDWTLETTCHQSRLTINDTLKKELEIRRLTEEADEEEQEELDELDDEDDFDDDISETGFHSDDEDGFAESDDSDDDSDYEWWAPRKSRAASPYVRHDGIRPFATRAFSDSSIDSDEEVSPVTTRRRVLRTQPVPIPKELPDLPDSTDFVCGTLDEDRPLEQEYISCVEQRKAAKHRTCPQDIDPSFPVSDPEMGSDDDVTNPIPRGRTEEPRGRRLTPRRSPNESPALPRSPAPKKCGAHRSPAPKGLFSHASPRRRSPGCARLTSPPPSRRASNAASPNPRFGMPFLSMRPGEPSYTASLPRSPAPFRRRCSPLPRVEDDEDDGSLTDRPSETPIYRRGAMDIAQGLERKRLKRREKFYQRYLRKEEKKERRGRDRPSPGKGAQRMRQIGLDCAVYRGKRMLSI